MFESDIRASRLLQNPQKMSLEYVPVGAVEVGFKNLVFRVLYLKISKIRILGF